MRDGENVDKLLDELSDEDMKQLRIYYKNRINDEVEAYFQNLMEMDKDSRYQTIFRMSEGARRLIHEKYIDKLFKVLKKLSKEERDAILEFFSEEEREAFEVYLENTKDDDDGEKGGGAFSLDAPKVLRPYKTLNDILGKALSESLMARSFAIREAIHRQQLERYEALIEEAEQMDKEREEEMEEDMGVSHGRGGR
jgi:hypothetical protein